MPITYRLFNPDTDYPRQAEIANSTMPENPITAEQLQGFDGERPSEYFHYQLVALLETGLMAGFGRVSQSVDLKLDDLQLVIRVDPNARRQGVGGGLYGQLLIIAQQQQAKRLFARVVDYSADDLAFAERRGFVLNRHLFESRLDVLAFDETPFLGLLEAVNATGITFTNLAELGDTPENRQKLYQLDQLTAADVPGEAPGFESFEVFERQMFPEGRALPEAVILALDSDQWVGFTALFSLGDLESLWHFMTGVDRRYRGRKVALAVKLLSIRYANQHGIKYLETSNDSANAPMLAINEKLGYQRLHGVYTLIKSLA